MLPLPIQNANTGVGYFLLTGDTKVIDTLISVDHPGGVWNASDRQIRMTGGDIYTARDTLDSGSRLHLIDIPSSQSHKNGNLEAKAGAAALDNGGGESSPTAENDQLWGRLIAEITYIASLKTVMFDHKAVYENLKRDWSKICMRLRARSASEGKDLHNSLVLGDLELIGVPYIEKYLPPDDPNLMSKFLCEWPILVIDIVESTATTERQTYVMPLDPVQDVIFVTKGFRKELDKFLEGPPTENHFDFSVFSALHVMELLASYSVNEDSITNRTGGEISGGTASSDHLWIPFALRADLLRADSPIVAGSGGGGGGGSGYRSLLELNNAFADFGKELLTDPFCAYQFLRFVCISIRNGFESLVDQNPDQPLPFYHALAALRRNIRNMSICSRIGLRCSYSPVKYTALLLYGISEQSAHRISHTDLLRLSQYTRVKCDVGNIFPTDPKRLLPIHKLSSFLSEVIERTPIIAQDVTPSELGSAFERLRQIGNSSSSYESVWFQFNADLFYMSTIAQQTMRGEISQKSVSSIWDLPRNLDPNIQWIAVFAAGFAFTLELPSRILDFLENGRLNRELDDLFDECGDEKDYFLIHLDYKDLPWQDYRERLKEMYRLKDSWTKLELCAWLDRCLTKNSESINDIIQKYLKSRVNTMQYENENLHLEKR